LDLISANPQLITWFGDLWLKNQDGPGHTEMAERAKMMLAPPIQQMLAQQAQGQSPVPPAIQAQMQQLQQRLQDAEKLLQHAAQELQSDNAKHQTDLRKTQMEIESKERIAALDRETKITVAELGAKVDRMSLFLEERDRAIYDEWDKALRVRGGTIASRLFRARDQVAQALAGKEEPTRMPGPLGCKERVPA
jgi:hypothetical protein